MRMLTLLVVPGSCRNGGERSAHPQCLVVGVELEDRGGVDGEHGADGLDDDVHQLVEVAALERALAEAGDRRLLGDVALERGVDRPQPLAGAIERHRGVADLDLHRVEALGHRVDLVAGADPDRLDVGARVRGVEAPLGERLHGPGEVGDRVLGQAIGGGRDLLGGVGDDPRQHEADGDGQQRDCDEDVGQDGEQRLLVGAHVADREQVAGAVEHHHRDHRAGELEVQRPLDARRAGAAAVGPRAPRVEQRAGVGECEAGEYGRQAELLEAEEGGKAARAGGDQAEGDPALRRAVRPPHVGLVAAQQPHRDARHADRDQVAEVGGGDHPDRVAAQQEDDRHPGGEDRRHPGHVVARALGEHARQQPVLGELRQRPRRAGQRLQRPVEHVEDHEPDRRGLGRAAEQRGERRAERPHQLALDRVRAEGAEPDDRQHDEVQRSDPRRREHGSSAATSRGPSSRPRGTRPRRPARRSRSGRAPPSRW
jgi:hypothetical protein